MSDKKNIIKPIPQFLDLNEIAIAPSELRGFRDFIKGWKPSTTKGKKNVVESVQNPV